MDELPHRKWLRHQVPPQVPDLDPVFFLTLCCQKRGTNQIANPSIWPQFLETVTRRNESKIWRCSLFLAMPDHVHGIFRFPGQKPMKELIADWKRWTARQLEIDWQKGFFDHRLRDEANAVAKRNYILNNPVRANLVEHPHDWPYFYDEFKTERRNLPDAR